MLATRKLIGNQSGMNDQNKTKWNGFKDVCSSYENSLNEYQNLIDRYKNHITNYEVKFEITRKQITQEISSLDTQINYDKIN